MKVLLVSLVSSSGMSFVRSSGTCHSSVALGNPGDSELWLSASKEHDPNVAGGLEQLGLLCTASHSKDFEL